MTTPIAQGPVDVNVSRCTVRVKTTAWADKRGLHTKKSLTFLRRQCEGFNILAEDADAIGAEEGNRRAGSIIAGTSRLSAGLEGFWERR